MICMLLLYIIDKMSIQLSIHNQYIISFILRSLNIGILFLYISSIQIYNIIVFICLIYFYQIFIFFQCKILIIGIFQQDYIVGSFCEFFIRQYSILDKHFQVIPFLFIFFPAILENISQAIGYFFRNMIRNFLYIPITL